MTLRKPDRRQRNAADGQGRLTLRNRVVIFRPLPLWKLEEIAL